MSGTCPALILMHCSCLCVFSTDEMVAKGQLDVFVGLDKQPLAKDRFRRRMSDLMPLTATLGGSEDNQHLKLSTLLQNLRRRHKWGRWKMKAGEHDVWVCNIPGHAYTKKAVEVVSSKKGQPTVSEIHTSLQAAGVEVNSDVPTEVTQTNPPKHIALLWFCYI